MHQKHGSNDYATQLYDAFFCKKFEKLKEKEKRKEHMGETTLRKSKKESSTQGTMKMQVLLLQIQEGPSRKISQK